MEEHERLPAELASQVESLFVSQPEADVSAAVETLFQVERAISTDELSGAISPQDAARARGIMHDPDALFGYVRASECRADAAAMLVLASAHGEDDGATHAPAGGAHVFEGDGDESPLHALSEVTGLAPEEAIVLLEAAGGDLSAAVSLHIENGEADAELRRRQARQADEERQASAAAEVAAAQASQAAERGEPPPPGEAAGPSPASARGASARGAAPAARARRRLPARARASEEPAPRHAEAGEVERLRARAVLELAPLLWQLKASDAPVGSRDLAAAAAGSFVLAGRGDPRANIGFLREYLEFWLVPPAPSLAPSLRSPLEITPAHFEPFALDGPLLSGAGHARPDGPGRGAPLLLLHLALLDPSASWYGREALRCAAIWSTERTLYEAAPSAPDELLLVVNCRGFGWRNFDQAALVELFWLLFKTYPSSLVSVLLLHAPLAFHAAWRILRALLPPPLQPLFLFVGAGSGPRGIETWVAPELLPSIEVATPLRTSPLSSSLERYRGVSVAELRRARGCSSDDLPSPPSSPPTAPPPASPPDFMEALAAAAARMDGGGALAADGCSAAAEIRASASPLNEPAQATAPPPNLTARYAEKLIGRAGRARGEGRAARGDASSSVRQAPATPGGGGAGAGGREGGGAEGKAEALEAEYVSCGDPAVLLPLAAAHVSLGHKTVGEELYRRLLCDERCAPASELKALELREAARRGLEGLGRVSKSAPLSPASSPAPCRLPSRPP